MRILLVEDDASLGATVQSWLQMDGHAVDWLLRGDQAVTALRTGRACRSGGRPLSQATSLRA